MDDYAKQQGSAGAQRTITVSVLSYLYPPPGAASRLAVMWHHISGSTCCQVYDLRTELVDATAFEQWRHRMGPQS